MLKRNQEIEIIFFGLFLMWFMFSINVIYENKVNLDKHIQLMNQINN